MSGHSVEQSQCEAIQGPRGGLLGRFASFITVVVLTLLTSLQQGHAGQWQRETENFYDWPNTECFVRSSRPISMAAGYRLDGSAFISFFPDSYLEKQLTEDFTRIPLVSIEILSETYGPFVFTYNENLGNLYLDSDSMRDVHKIIASGAKIRIHVEVSGTPNRHLFVVDDPGGKVAFDSLHNCNPTTNGSKTSNTLSLGNPSTILSATCIALDSAVVGTAVTGFGGRDKLNTFNISIDEDGVVLINGQRINPKYWEHHSNGSLTYTAIPAADMSIALGGGMAAARMMPNVSDESANALAKALQGMAGIAFGGRDRVFFISLRENRFVFSDVVNGQLTNLANARCG